MEGIMKFQVGEWTCCTKINQDANNLKRNFNIHGNMYYGNIGEFIGNC